MQENIIGLVKARGISYLVLRKNRFKIVIKWNNKENSQSYKNVYPISQLRDGIAWDILTVVMARGRFLDNMPLPRILHKRK